MTLHTYTGSGIWTTWHIQRYSSETSSVFLQREIRKLISTFESKYSRFDQNSLIWQLNTNKTIQTNDEDLYSMIALWQESEQKSHGYFSLFVGWKLESLWYGIQAPTDQINESFLVVEKNTNTIRIEGNGHIDLWWIGKWYLISLIEKLFVENNITLYRINGGGDIAIAQGDDAVFGDILLKHPLEENQYIGSIQLSQGACCSSGTFYRHRTYEWNVVHHLIDPKTWLSVQTPIIAVYIIHPSIIIADIASTTLFVSPLEYTEQIAQDFWVEYMIVFDDLSSIRSPGFPLVA